MIKPLTDKKPENGQDLDVLNILSNDLFVRYRSQPDCKKSYYDIQDITAVTNLQAQVTDTKLSTEGDRRFYVDIYLRVLAGFEKQLIK